MKKEDREKLNDILYLIRDAEYILKDAKRLIRERKHDGDFKITQRMIDYANHVHDESTNFASEFL